MPLSQPPFLLAQVCCCPPSFYTHLFFLPKFSPSPLLWSAKTHASLFPFLLLPGSAMETILLHVSFMCTSLFPNILKSPLLYSQGIALFHSHTDLWMSLYCIYISIWGLGFSSFWHMWYVFLFWHPSSIFYISPCFLHLLCVLCQIWRSFVPMAQNPHHSPCRC